MKYIKYFLLITTILIHLTATAQSPYLSILVKMDSLSTDGIRYKIEMKICEPTKMTKYSDWFSHDTSTINFGLLKANDFKCGDFFDKGLPTLISGEEEAKSINQFEFGNQYFAWEHVFIFRISNVSSRGWNPDMYIIMPMKYKSFRTRIDLTDIKFQAGKVIFLTGYTSAYDDSKLVVNQSLKDHTGVEAKTFQLKELLEEK